MHTTYAREYFRDGNWMIDVRTGRRILATLVPVFLGGEVQRAQE